MCVVKHAHTEAHSDSISRSALVECELWIRFYPLPNIAFLNIMSEIEVFGLKCWSSRCPRGLTVGYMLSIHSRFKRLFPHPASVEWEFF